jgi:hypothetical protein
MDYRKESCSSDGRGSIALGGSDREAEAVRPTHLTPALNRVVRTVIVFVLAVATYLLYYHWLGTAVLHEPAMLDSYGGNALIGMDWVTLILFGYVVSFGLYEQSARPI